jgi:RHS repeat-associated protein
VEGSSVWSQTFKFDPFGNINKTGNNGGISFQPTYTSSPSTNQYSSIPGVTGPYYDGDGNLLKDGFYTYTWDADGNSITAGGIEVTFDAFDRAVEENSSGSYTQFVYGPRGGKLALMSGQTLYRGRVPLPGGGRAVYTSGPTLLRYWHPNWQGSIPLGTNPNQTIFMDGAYAPYGEQYAGAPLGDFTGQVTDTQPYLYDFLYREYHPIQGRWISPDPAGLAAVNPSDPQTWNRYAYVRNSPLFLRDRKGLDDDDDDDDDGGGGCTADCGDDGGGGGGGGGGGNYGSGGSSASPSYGIYISYSNTGEDSTVIVSDLGEAGLGAPFSPLGWGGYFLDVGSSGGVMAGTTPCFGGEAFCESSGNVVRARPIESDDVANLALASAAGKAASVGNWLLENWSTLPRMQVAVGAGEAPSYLHVAYGTEGSWLHATGEFFDMGVTDRQAAAWVRGFSWFRFRVPVMNSAAVKATNGVTAWS